MGAASTVNSVARAHALMWSFSASDPLYWAGLLGVVAATGIGQYLYSLILVSPLFSWTGYIDPGFPSKEKFDTRDYQYLTINTVISALLLYHFNQFVNSSSDIVWGWSEATLRNTLGTTLLQFALYDFFYHWFHRILHIGWIYPYIHKHHHKQKAPIKAVLDGINVHPFEMLVGSYLHIAVVYAVPCHMIGAQLFFGLAATMAALNH